MEYFKGNCIRDNVCYLKETQYLSSEEIINLQKNKLTKLLKNTNDKKIIKIFI